MNRTNVSGKNVSSANQVKQNKTVAGDNIFPEWKASGGEHNQVIDEKTQAFSSDFISSDEKGAVNGIATLDAMGELTASQVPSYLLGSLNYQGTWDASGGVPPYVADPANKGYYFIISVGGTIGGVVYFVGDMIVSTGAIWQRIEGSADTFTRLTDVPNSYLGAALKGLRVKVGEDGLEFVDLYNPPILATKNADYVILDNDNLETILVTAGAVDRTITLPLAANNTNRKITVKKIDSGIGNVIVEGNGAETIDDNLNILIINQYKSYTMICDGFNWWII